MCKQSDYSLHNVWIVIDIDVYVNSALLCTELCSVQPSTTVHWCSACNQDPTLFSPFNLCPLDKHVLFFFTRPSPSWTFSAVLSVSAFTHRPNLALQPVRTYAVLLNYSNTYSFMHHIQLLLSRSDPVEYLHSAYG